MEKFLEICLDINGKNRYHLLNIDSAEYFEKIYEPVYLKGGIIKDISENDYKSHKNYQYEIMINLLSIDNVKTYCSEFVSKDHENAYLEIFKEKFNKKNEYNYELHNRKN